MRTSWDQTWLAVADVIGRRSWCARRQVGAVLVDATNRVVATGYNGPPRGWTITDSDCSDECPRFAGAATINDYDDCVALHAEANALLFVDRRLLEGGAAYVNTVVCLGCAKLLANSGVRRVVYRLTPDMLRYDPDRSIEYLTKCGIETEAVWGEA